MFSFPLLCIYKQLYKHVITVHNTLKSSCVYKDLVYIITTVFYVIVIHYLLPSTEVVIVVDNYNFYLQLHFVSYNPFIKCLCTANKC